MKKLKLSFFFLLATIVAAFSQVPGAFNYQAVVRDASGVIVANQNVSFRISILQGSESGTVVYSETHATTTNAFGLANLKIGQGTAVSGTFSPTGWGTSPHFIKIELDASGGSSYNLLGTSQLLSVPYAFHAETVTNVNDADADASNELQTIDLSGTVLTLSDGGGSVTLPSSGGGDNWGTQTVKTDATLSGEGTTANPISVVGDLTDNQTLSVSGNDLSISDGNTVTLPAASGGDNWGTQTIETDATITGDGTTTNPLSAVDGDATNELQTLNLSGTQLSLSDGGGSVTLPSSGGGDNWGTQTVETDATLSGEGTTANPISVVGDLTDNQTLSVSGNDLSISDGNTVTLPAASGGDNWGTQTVETDATITGDGTTANPLSSVDGDATNELQTLSKTGNLIQLSNGGGTVTDEVDDADADPANEIQQLSLNGTLLELSNGGGSVTLPTSGSGGGDNWGAQTVKTDATLTGNGTSTSPLKVVGNLTDNQTLSVSGHELSISGGNTVNLSGSNFWTQTGNILSYPSGTVQIGSIPITDEGVLLDVRTTDKPFAFYAENNDINSTIQIRNLGTGGAAWFHNKIKISDGTQGAGKVLTSDADGNSSWQTPATGGSSFWEDFSSGIYYGAGPVAVGNRKHYSNVLFSSDTNDDIIAIAAANSGEHAPLYTINNGTGPAAEFDGQIQIFDGTEGAGKVLTSDASGKSSWQTPATSSSLWTEDGSDIYRNTGKIGIGTNSPSFMLDITSSTGLASLGVKSNTENAIIYLDKKYTNKYAYILHRTNGVNMFYVGLLGDNNYKISAGSSTLNGLEVTTDGNVNLSNNLNITGTVKIAGGTPGVNKVLTSDANGLASWKIPAGSLWTESGSNIYRSSGNVGIGTTTPAAPLEIKSNSLPSLIIGSASSNHPNRPGIQFKNNTSQYISGDDGSDEVFGFYATWANTRIHDAKLRVYGNVASSWGTYIEMTHNGTDGFITTDVGDIDITPAGKVGIKTNAPTQTLDVNGNARIRSIPSGTGTYAIVVGADGTFSKTSSDIRLKENISTLNNSLDKILKLRGVSFTWKANPEYGTRIGFIAQEFEKVIPELSFTNPVDGYKGINYAEVSAVLVEAVKEQQKIIESLKSENKQIVSRLEKLENLMSGYAKK